MRPYPKVELHVHLEGTVRAPTLKQIAKRNDYPLPDDLESQTEKIDYTKKNCPPGVDRPIPIVDTSKDIKVLTELR